MWAGRNDQFRSHVLHGVVYAAALHDASSQGRYSKLKGEPFTEVSFLKQFLRRCCSLAVKISSDERPVENIRNWNLQWHHSIGAEILKSLTSNMKNWLPVSLQRCLGGAVASWLVRSNLDRAVPVWALAEDTALYSWTRHFTLTVPLSTQVYKWVPAN